MTNAFFILSDLLLKVQKCYVVNREGSFKHILNMLSTSLE